MAEYEDRKVAQETAALQRFHTQLLEQSQQEEGCIHNTTTSGSSAITTAAAVTVAAAVVEGTHHSIPSTIHNRTGGVHTSTTTTTTTNNTITSPVKPGVVVRESTQDHITQMHRHNIGTSTNLGMSAAQTASMNAYNNKNLGRKKTNIGTGSVENSSLPAIHSNSTTSSTIKTSAKVKKPSSSPMTSAQVKNTPTTTSTTGIGLLQTLQAHPPRNPPPHNTRSEVLRTRGISPLKQQSAHAPYIPQSSDEGENSNTEDDEEGFIISQMTSCASLMGRQRSAIDDQMSLVSDGDSRSGTPGGVSYISSSTSCASRPMSVTQDSPSPGVVRNSDTATTTAAAVTTTITAIATNTCGGDNDSVVSADSMDLSIDGQSADSTTEVLQATTVSGIINQSSSNSSSSSSSSSTDVQLSEAVKATNQLTKPDSISTTTPITNTTTSITGSRDDSTDLDDTVIRPATTTTTAVNHTLTSTVNGRTASADGTTTTTTSGTTTSGDTTSSGKKKHKRISSAKAITNAFREGIKILTGSSSSRSRSNTNNSNTSGSTEKKTTAVLKTASTDSTVSCNTSLSISHSNSSTPTNAKHHTTTTTATTTTSTHK